MLFPKRLWPGIADGSVTLAFRRWERPRARAGARHRTPAGVVEIDSIKAVDPARITDAAARRAGAADADEIRAILARRAGTHYRIAFHFAGADPRIEPAPPTLPDSAWAELAAELERIDRRPSAAVDDRDAAADRRSAGGRGRRPRRAVGGAAALQGRRPQAQGLGLTESLRPGYRLSPGRRAARLPQPKSDALAVRARSISGEGMIPSPTTTSAVERDAGVQLEPGRRQRHGGVAVEERERHRR
jgi:hypothetical protein